MSIFRRWGIRYGISRLSSSPPPSGGAGDISLAFSSIGPHIEAESAARSVDGACLPATAAAERPDGGGEGEGPVPQPFDGSLCCAHRRRGEEEKAEAVSVGESRAGGPPRDQFDGEMIFVTIGRSSNVDRVETAFIDRLIYLGVSGRNLVIICLDEVCQRRFDGGIASEVPRVELYDDARLGTSRAPGCASVKGSGYCRMHMGRVDVVSEILEGGDAAFFIDSGVDIYRHPYDSLIAGNANLDLYLFEDQNLSINARVMLVYPSPLTLGLFRYVQEEFARTHFLVHDLINMYLRTKEDRWGRAVKYSYPDEDPESRGVCGDGLDYEFLPSHSYVNTVLLGGVLGDWILGIPQSQPWQHVLVVPTCIEGDKTREMALLTMFGDRSRSAESTYLHTKTVALDAPLHLYVDPPDGRVDAALRTLAYVAKRTGRAVRLTGETLASFDDARNPYSIVSADYLWGELGVPMVEPLFYARALQWHGRGEPSTALINLSDGEGRGLTMEDEAAGLRRKFEQLSFVAKYSEADELVFQLEDLVRLDSFVLGALVGVELRYKYGKWERPFTCLKAQHTCLSVCEGL